MSGRILLTVIFVLALLLAGLLTAPVFSGEHPWDSDRSGSRPPGGAVIPGQHDTLITMQDTAVTTVNTTAPATATPRWVRVITAAWSAMMSI